MITPIELAAKLSALDASKQALVIRLIDALSDTTSSLPPFDFQLAFRQWLDFLMAQRLSTGTIHYYTRYVKTFFDTFPQPSPAHLDAFAALLSPSETHRAKSALRNFFTFCDMRGIYPNIASHLKNPYHFKPRQPAPHDTVAALLALDLKPRDACILALFIETGARLGELRTIELANVLDTFITVTGKGSKTRPLYLTPFAKKALDLHISTLPPDAKYLFPTRTGRPLGAREIQRLIARLCARVGAPRCTPHQFRHFFTTHLLQSGASLKAVSDLLGHASVSTTANVYWHLVDNDAREQAIKYSPGKSIRPPEEE